MLFTSNDENSEAGQVIYTANVSDVDNLTANLYFTTKHGDASNFTINSITGAVTLNVVPDYETKSEYTFTVVASDGTPLNKL